MEDKNAPKGGDNTNRNGNGTMNAKNGNENGSGKIRKKIDMIRSKVRRTRISLILVVAF